MYRQCLPVSGTECRVRASASLVDVDSGGGFDSVGFDVELW